MGYQLLENPAKADVFMGMDGGEDQDEWLRLSRTWRDRLLGAGAGATLTLVALWLVLISAAAAAVILRA